MAAPRAFPLLVEGSWGPDHPKNLSTKLQMFLQSSKKSDGGECEVRAEPGTPPRFLVLFSQEDDQVNWEDHLSGISEIASTQTEEGLNLILISGDVTCFSTDVIVNTIPPNLQLGGGPLSQSLLQKGGPMLQEQLQAAKQETSEKVGSMFMTSGCNLDCKAVLHVVAPDWNNGNQSSLEIMRNIIEKCLINIEQHSFQSITFPLIGTGQLNFPKIAFADLILSEVFKFSSSSWKKSLQEVHFVVHPGDDEGHQAFLDEFNKRSSEAANMVKILKPGGTQGNAVENSVVPDDINDSVENFPWKLSNTSLKDLNVVISGPQLLNIVHDYMKQREASESHPLQSLISKTAYEIPSHWNDMQQKDVCVVDLPPHHQEYKVVASQFKQSCSTSIISKIERIQNLDLWNSYQAKKKAMEAKNGFIINEKQLFHGTDVDSVPYINRNGFNRSYAGKNGKAFGKGTYFAVNASYSAKDKYSKPDNNGEKYMFFVRVLTGLFTLGNPSLIVPPPKDPQNPTDLYDSVTDNVQKPKLFVVFYDYQAYPEYLITYRQ